MSYQGKSNFTQILVVFRDPCRQKLKRLRKTRGTVVQAAKAESLTKILRWRKNDHKLSYEQYTIISRRQEKSVRENKRWRLSRTVESVNESRLFIPFVTKNMVFMTAENIRTEKMPIWKTKGRLRNRVDQRNFRL